MLRQSLRKNNGGSGEIRTHGGVAPSAVFKTAALNHSATLPHGAFKHEGGYISVGFYFNI